MRVLLRTDDVGSIGHYTGATSVYAFSSVADVVSSGFEVHDFHALSHGDRSGQGFSEALASALTAAGLPYSLVVHAVVQALP